MNKKVAISLVGDKLTDSKKSHKAGWAMMWKCQLIKELGVDVDVITDNTTWDIYDIIYLYHDMAFAGSLNLFGGATEKTAKYYERLINKNNIELISLDIPMPDYGELCKTRLKSSDEYWKNVNWDLVSESCKKIKYITQSSLNNKSLIIGDSHAFSVYDGKSSVLRKDGRTLAGVLKKSLIKEINDYCFNIDKIEDITAYYGNIDIRHHILREDSPFEYMDNLINEYGKQLLNLNKNISVVLQLPIEDESRKLPKTGFYKGTPFYGNWKERNEVLKYMHTKIIEMCNDNNFKIISWDKHMYDITPMKYMNTYMEGRQSVHLAPLYHKWDYWSNTLNTPAIGNTLLNFL